MKINIHQFPQDNTLNLRETSDAALLDLDTPEIRFISPIEISAEVTKISNTLLVGVQVKGLIQSVCSRCLEELKLDFFKEFKFDYPIKKNEYILDITDDIRQEIILGCPMKFLCKEDCRGLCPVCGQNLNRELCRHVELSD